MTDDNVEWPTGTDATSALAAADDCLWEFGNSSSQVSDLFDSLGEMLDLTTSAAGTQSNTPEVTKSKKISAKVSKGETKSSNVSKRKSVPTNDEDDDNCFEHLNLDGLGALRPSTSFNDFAHLLLPDCMDGANDGSSGFTPMTSPVVVSSSSLADGTSSSKTGTKSKSGGGKRSSKHQKTDSSSSPSSKKGTNPSSVVSKALNSKVNQSKSNSNSANHLPRFNGIGKKTTSSTASSEVSTSSSTANAVSLQSSPLSTHSIVDLPKSTPQGSSSVSAKQHNINVNHAVDSAVATAAAAAANLLKQHTALSGDSGSGGFSLGGSAATGYSFKDSASSNATSSSDNSHGSSGNLAGTASAPGSSSVNTSTDHIHALTSSNWVAACNASGVTNFSSNSSNSSVASNAPTTSSAPTVVTSSTTVSPITISGSTNVGNPVTAGNANNSLTAAQQQAAAAAAQAAANKRRRQNLTADERAKQNRDRNREHARNTRLRKKAYVEELKKTLTELVHQRDAAEVERKRLAQRELEQREVRFRVLEEFLKLRGGAKAATIINGATESKWCAILEDQFQLTLPVTSYREMVHGHSQHDSSSKVVPTTIARQVTNPPLLHEMDNDDAEHANLTLLDSSTLSKNSNQTANSGNDTMEQVLTGVKEVMDDASLVSNLLEILGRSSNSSSEDSTKNAKIYLSYTCDKSRMMMDGTNVVVPWTAQSVGAVVRVCSI